MSDFSTINLDEVTRFDEIKVADRDSQFNLKPTWGISDLRYQTTTTGTGAAATEENGEFKLTSGTATSNVTEITTLQRGQYIAGAMGQAGIGVRIPTNPASTAEMKWGYTDFENGFYYGIDSTSPYVATVTGGTVNEIHQADWNIDTLDGSGPSGETLDFTDGVITQIDFVWYGYGDIEFNFYFQDSSTGKLTRVTAHRENIANAASVRDPNQPLSFRVENGASNTTSYDLYIGGHQFSIIGGTKIPQQRSGSELITNFTTATNTDWQPLIAMRKKATFRSRNNSVKTKVAGIEVAADGNVETRITVNGTTSNLSWATPTGKSASETAVETKVSGGTALTTSSAGEPIKYGFATGTNREVQSLREDVDFFLGETQETILWVRRLSASGAIVIQHANIEWVEEW